MFILCQLLMRSSVHDLEFTSWHSDSCLVGITRYKITYSAFYRFLDNVQRLTNVQHRFNTTNFPQFYVSRIKDKSFCSNKSEFNINLNQSRIILTVLAALSPKIHLEKCVSKKLLREIIFFFQVRHHATRNFFTTHSYFLFFEMKILKLTEMRSHWKDFLPLNSIVIKERIRNINYILGKPSKEKKMDICKKKAFKM